MNQQDIIQANEQAVAEHYSKTMADLGAHFDLMTEEPDRHANLEYDANAAQRALQSWRALPSNIREREHGSLCPLVICGYIGDAVCLCPEAL